METFIVLLICTVLIAASLIIGHIIGTVQRDIDRDKMENSVHIENIHIVLNEKEEPPKAKPVNIINVPGDEIIDAEWVESPEETALVPVSRQIATIKNAKKVKKYVKALGHEKKSKWSKYI